MTVWITDRQPVAYDADLYREVQMQTHPRTDMYALVHWRHVGPGVPWCRTGVWEPPTIAAEPQALQPEPRRFVSLSRTINTQGFTTLDAIDQDGRAWWLVLGDDAAPDEWTELLPLPTREEQP